MFFDENNIGKRSLNNFSGSAVLPYEPETIATLLNAGITDTPTGTIYAGLNGSDIYPGIDARIVAIKTILGLPLKSANLVSKMPAFYLTIGSSAAEQGFNVSLNSAYNIVFFGGYTFNASGCLPNGTNAYAETNMQLSDELLPRNYTIFMTLKTNSDGLFADSGMIGAPNGNFLLYGRQGSNVITRGGDSGTNNSTPSSNSNAFFLLTCNSASEYKVYKNGVLINTISATINTVFSNGSLIINAVRSGGSIIQFSNRKWTSFAAINQALSAADVASLYSEINGIDTFLGR